MSVPDWFSVTKWSTPVSVEELRANRQQLPRLPGVYAFTNYEGPLEKNTGVLYVGKGASLFTRVQSYLVDPGSMPVMSRRSQTVSSSLKHPGKAQLLVKIQQRARDSSPCGVGVRWSGTVAPETLEELLLAYLKPAYNTYGTSEADSDA